MLSVSLSLIYDLRSKRSEGKGKEKGGPVYCKKYYLRQQTPRLLPCPSPSKRDDGKKKKGEKKKEAFSLNLHQCSTAETRTIISHLKERDKKKKGGGKRRNKPVSQKGKSAVRSLGRWERRSLFCRSGEKKKKKKEAVEALNLAEKSASRCPRRLSPAFRFRPIQAGGGKEEEEKKEAKSSL